MRCNGRKRWNILKPADLIIAGALVLLGVLGLLVRPGSAGRQVVTIKENNKIVYTGALDSPAHVEIDGKYQNIIVVQDGQAWIESSDCPGRDCMHMGKIDRAGQSIACAPNGVIVVIEGEGGVDDVAN